jgi:hypothetical protein
MAGSKDQRRFSIMKKPTAPAGEAIMNKLLILTVLALTILGVTATIETLLPQTHPIVIADGGCTGSGC